MHMMQEIRNIISVFIFEEVNSLLGFALIELLHGYSYVDARNANELMSLIKSQHIIRASWDHKYL